MCCRGRALGPAGAEFGTATSRATARAAPNEPTRIRMFGFGATATTPQAGLGGYWELVAAGVLVVLAAVLIAALLTRGGPSPASSPYARTSSNAPAPTKSRPPVRARFELIQLSSSSGSRHPKHRMIRIRARTTALRIK